MPADVQDGGMDDGYGKAQTHTVTTTPYSMTEDELGPAAQQPESEPRIPPALRPRNARQYVGDDRVGVLGRTLGMVLERQTIMANWLAERMATRQEAPKPILTTVEAARLIGVSPKTMANIISRERAELGRLPDFVCNASGKMGTRIIRDELMTWIRSSKRRVGRPPKRMV